jgi:hypothetical protein
MICYGISRACLSRAFQHSSDSLFRHHKPDVRATKEEVQYGGYWQQWACDWGNWQGGIGDRGQQRNRCGHRAPSVRARDARSGQLGVCPWLEQKVGIGT